MNVSQAISHLKRLGWHVSKEGANYRVHKIGHKMFSDPPSDYCLYSPRELVKLAKTYSSENNQQTAIKKAIKSGQKVERRVVRDVISTGDVDKIDEIFTDKLEDIWNFD